MERLRRKTGLSDGEIMLRVKRQMPYGEKIKYADYTINNNGKASETKIITGKLVKKLKQDMFKK